MGAGLAAVALLAAGCGTGGVASSGGARPDTHSGQQLFTQRCAACHTLAAAGASGTIGPNLDDAFGSDVKQGYAQSTIENLVLDQIRLGSGEVATYTNNKHFTTTPSMPANLVTGQDAKDVAAYVASVAGTGVSGGSSGSIGTSGDAIFKSQCAGCHTLSAAGSSGTVGPNLDQRKPSLAIVVRQVTNGGSIMPAFKGKLTPAQIQAVAKYVSSNAGK
ncbi:MAG TPA: c-type cytochrome [Gaiellaceae bacterium]|nr:c-type cytochrome [Gaiellaceae bacterium]